jgi:hypothetical protein
MRLEQADTTIAKNVIIGKPREAPKVEKISGHKVVLEKDEDGKNKLKITVGSAKHLRSWPARSCNSSGSGVHVLRTFMTRRHEIDTWTSNEVKSVGKVVRGQCAFDKFMSKYKKDKADSMNRLLKKRESLHLLSKKSHSSSFVVSQVVTPL